MADATRTLSRHIYENIVPEGDPPAIPRVFEFGPDKLSVSGVRVYLQGDLLEQGLSPPGNPKDYIWINNQADIELTQPPPIGSTLTMVRVTPRDALVSQTQLLFLAQETTDTFVFNDNLGPKLLATGTDPSVLLMNRYRVDDPDDPNDPEQFVFLPVVQLLPDGRLAADPDGVNPGGFRKATLRFEHHIPANIGPHSESTIWCSVIADRPDSLGGAFSKHSTYAMKVTIKGHQEALDNDPDHFSQESVAFNPVAVIAAGALSGEAHGIVVESRHEEWISAALRLGAGPKEIRFIADPENYPEEAGLAIRIRIAKGATPGVSVTGTDIDITIGEITDNTAAFVRDAVNDHNAASQLVSATTDGLGGGTVAETDNPNSTPPDFINLRPGTDGKLVGVQAIVHARGIDGGRGEYNIVKNQIELENDGFFQYGHTIHSSGTHPAFAALMAKGKADADVPMGPAWRNVLVADPESVTDRLVWLPGQFVIQVASYKDDPNDPNSPEHGSPRMGIGTDNPKSPFHLTAPTLVDARLENSTSLASGSDIARILVDGRGTGSTVETMAAIIAHLIQAADGNEETRLTLSTMLAGALAARWHVGKGLWAEGVAGQDKGAQTLNAKGLYVGGKRIVEQGTAAETAKVGLGKTNTDTINANGIITWKSSFMRIDTLNGTAATDDLDTINGASEGNKVLLRSTDAARVITIRDGVGNIHCRGNVILNDPRAVVELVFDGSVWLRCPSV